MRVSKAGSSQDPAFSISMKTLKMPIRQPCTNHGRLRKSAMICGLVFPLLNQLGNEGSMAVPSTCRKGKNGRRETRFVIDLGPDRRDPRAGRQWLSGLLQ